MVSSIVVSSLNLGVSIEFSVSYEVTHRSCIDDDGITHHSGTKWIRAKDCHRCQCYDGVSQCEAINNCPIDCLSQNDVNIQLNNDECCLPCKGKFCD